MTTKQPSTQQVLRAQPIDEVRFTQWAVARVLTPNAQIFVVKTRQEAVANARKLVFSVRDMESYIDKLLVSVLTTTPIHQQQLLDTLYRHRTGMYFKAQLLLDLLEIKTLIDSPTKSSLDTDIQKAGKLRNQFAHGTICSEDHVVLVKYNGVSTPLSTSFFQEAADHINKCYEHLDNINKAI